MKQSNRISYTFFQLKQVYKIKMVKKIKIIIEKKNEELFAWCNRVTNAMPCGGNYCKQQAANDPNTNWNNV